MKENPCIKCIIYPVCTKVCKARREWIRNRLEYDLTMTTIRDDNKRLEEFIYHKELDNGTVLEEA